MYFLGHNVHILQSSDSLEKSGILWRLSYALPTDYKRPLGYAVYNRIVRAFKCLWTKFVCFDNGKSGSWMMFWQCSPYNSNMAGREGALKMSFYVDGLVARPLARSLMTFNGRPFCSFLGGLIYTANWQAYNAWVCFCINQILIQCF